MSPEILGRLERLAATNIRILPAAELESWFILERNGFVALVERTQDGFGRIGSAGLLTDNGFAVLMWRGPQASFVAKGFERIAAPEEIAELRRFQADLSSALL